MKIFSRCNIPKMRSEAKGPFKGFTKIAGPQHGLVNESCKSTKKKTASVSLLWYLKHQEAFESMKRALTTAPVLGYTNYTKPGSILETDVSHDGLSAILSQEQNGKQCVIAYASQRLGPSEKNSSLYSSMKLEFLDMKWTITEKVHHYLLGGHFTVITDSNPLTYFHSAKLGALDGHCNWHSSTLKSNTNPCCP